MRIRTENIKVSLDSREILKGIDIDVNNKEFIGIIGPNGSGKSTLLKCIYRTLKPNAGIINFDEINIKNISIKETSKKISVLSQHNENDFDFTVKEMVLMGRSPHKTFLQRDSEKDYHIMNEALKKVEMIDFKERNFNTLSGGEKQRVILARALTQEADSIILDEPTNHLDIKYQLQLMNIVKNLNIEVIAAIHDLNIAAMYCDKIYVLKDGAIVESGRPEKVLTRELIKEVYEVDAEVRSEGGRLIISYIP